MTYYGRWGYKFERALEAGAAGCLVIHEDEPASYGWNVVQNGWSGERFDIIEDGEAAVPALAIQGWISRETAALLAKRSGNTLEQWHEGALEPGFQPIDTGVTLEGVLETTERQLSDVNVLGRLPGASKPEQAVFITAHWDHLGTEDEPADDQDVIFNGAIDNASGIAGMLAVAADLSQRKPALHRSVVFLATTAEEQGLLGSRYYATHPLVPIKDILAVVNLDSMNVHGATQTVQVVGNGQTSLEDVLGSIATANGRTVVPDEHPEAGSYYRSDHFAFAARGVPALYFRGGKDMAQGGTAAGEKVAQERARIYHTVHDEFDPSWSFGGALQDARLVAELVAQVANADEAPRWDPGSEFARLR
jgi:Zn-dependent M28 family amino/carboxypeptidase